jgi:PhnB protein
MSFHPYLAFAGNCRDAFTRYQEIFGGELQLLTMADIPESEAVPPEQADLVVHASLMADGQLLMGSDDPSGGFDGENRGTCVNVTVPDLSEGERVFSALAESGQVQVELAPTFFSPGFGMCTDRFGTPWMVVVADPDAAAPA